MQAPYLLVASPTMVDGNFARTVVLVLRHDDRGAHGLVINRPLELTVREVAESLDLDQEDSRDSTVLWGGPVQASTGFVLIKDPWNDDDDLDRVTDKLAMGLSKRILELAMERADQPFLLCLGYAGWAPNQLEDEMASGSWVEVDMNESVVFEAPLDERWESAIHLLGIENPAYLSTIPVDE